MLSALRVAVGLAVLLIFAPDGHAHAFLDRASPAVGSTVHAPPTSIRIWFTQEIESAFSTIKLIDAKGSVIASSNKAVDPSDRMLLRLPIQPLPPGTYRVVWHVLSIDSHVTEGDFTFEITP